MEFPPGRTNAFGVSQGPPHKASLRREEHCSLGHVCLSAHARAHTHVHDTLVSTQDFCRSPSTASLSSATPRKYEQHGNEVLFLMSNNLALLCNMLY